MNEVVKSDDVRTALPVGEVLTSISKAMGEVQKICRGERNNHDKYNFASIDDFLTMVNPICSNAGLLFLMEEESIEDFTRQGKFGESHWMRVTWLITAMHKSGQSLPPVRRRVEVLRNGAQAYGSSQSYALKQFLRSLLLIPTGDKDDADFQKTDSSPPQGGGEGGHLKKFTPEKGVENQIRNAIHDLDSCNTLEDLRDVWSSLAPNIKAEESVVKAKDARKAAIREKNAPPDNLPDSVNQAAALLSGG